MENPYEGMAEEIGGGWDIGDEAFEGEAAVPGANTWGIFVRQGGPADNLQIARVTHATPTRFYWMSGDRDRYYRRGREVGFFPSLREAEDAWEVAIYAYQRGLEAGAMGSIWAKRAIRESPGYRATFEGRAEGNAARVSAKRTFTRDDQNYFLAMMDRPRQGKPVAALIDAAPDMAEALAAALPFVAAPLGLCVPGRPTNDPQAVRCLIEVALFRAGRPIEAVPSARIAS